MPAAPDDPIHVIRRQLAAEITRSLGGSQSQHVIAPYFETFGSGGCLSSVAASSIAAPSNGSCVASIASVAR